MGKFGVKSLSFTDLYSLNEMNLKNDVLIFEKIYIDSKYFYEAYSYNKLYASQLPSVYADPALYQHNMRNLDFLLKEGILELMHFSNTLPYLSMEPELKDRINNSPGITSMNKKLDENFKLMLEISRSDELLPEAWLQSFAYLSDSMARLFSIYMLEAENTHIIPIVNDEKTFINEEFATKDFIVKFILNEMPQPDISTPWEQILNFKNDLDTRAKYYCLIDWVNNISQQNITRSDFEDHYNALYFDYLNQYAKHKIKYSKSTVEILTVGTAELFENMARLKFSKVAETFFKFIKLDANPTELELNTRGRELAYIHKANSIFK